MPEEGDERSEQAEENQEGDEGEKKQESGEKINDPLTRRAAKAAGGVAERALTTTHHS